MDDTSDSGQRRNQRVGNSKDGKDENAKDGKDENAGPGGPGAMHMPVNRANRKCKTTSTKTSAPTPNGNRIGMILANNQKPTEELLPVPRSKEISKKRGLKNGKPKSKGESAIVTHPEISNQDPVIPLLKPKPNGLKRGLRLTQEEKEAKFNVMNPMSTREQLSEFNNQRSWQDTQVPEEVVLTNAEHSTDLPEVTQVPEEVVLTNAEHSTDLPEAIPVEDEVVTDTEAQLFDVDESKKNKAIVEGSYKAKLCLLLILILSFLAAVVGLLLKQSKEELELSPTSAPTSHRSTLTAEFEEKILKALGDNYFDEEDDLVEVRRTALNWILNEDPMQLDSNADNLLQRYILTVFYFQTSQESPWIECGAGGADLCYYKVFMHESTTPGNSWLTANHECFWATVTCRNRTVEHIYMFDNGLHGSIPTEIALLSNLKDLYLTGNKFTGTIPTELSHLSSIESISLDRNELVGEIDWIIFKPLQNLKRLRLHKNSFMGSISSDIQHFGGIGLTLGMNSLTGSFPPEFYSLSNLNWWIANGNQLTGTISTEISRMVNLTSIDLSNTRMSGTLPSELGLLENLSEFGVSNSRMEGSLPEELFTGLSLLDHIDVSNCAFSGTISTSIGLQTSLNLINLANNAFVGTLPNNAFEGNTGLRDFFVNGNQFTGTFPESVCTNSFASQTKINDLVADCLPDEDTEIVAMECVCCTECCRPNTRICLNA